MDGWFEFDLLELATKALLSLLMQKNKVEDNIYGFLGFLGFCFFCEWGLILIKTHAMAMFDSLFDGFLYCEILILILAFWGFFLFVDFLLSLTERLWLYYDGFSGFGG